jgi:hypothetical protein
MLASYYIPGPKIPSSVNNPLNMTLIPPYCYTMGARDNDETKYARRKKQWTSGE